MEYQNITRSKEISLDKLDLSAFSATRTAIPHLHVFLEVSGLEIPKFTIQKNKKSLNRMLFSEYNQTAAQVLLTKYTMINDHSRNNARNTLQSLLHMGAIPIVNENDTVSTDEIEFINTIYLDKLHRVLLSMYVYSTPVPCS